MVRAFAGVALALAVGCSSGEPAGGTGGAAGSGGLSGTGGAAGAAGSAVGGFAGLGFECGTGEPVADDRPLPKDVTAAAPNLELAATSRRIEVWAPVDSPLLDSEVTDFGKGSCQALLFDLDVHQVPQADLSTRVRIVVVDGPTFDLATGAPGAYGVAFSATKSTTDAVILPADGLENLVELDDTLAHELTHVISGRAAPYDAWLPWWLIEGIAVLSGSQLGKKLHDQPTSFVMDWLDIADGSDAELTFQRYGLEDQTQNLGEVGHDQALSGFFIEFLRVKVGIADVQKRLLGVMRKVSDGDDFDATFAAELGVPLGQAQADYAKFLDDTAGDLAKRYAGTVFE
ncbi:MAG: hypothetical protein IT377_16320 [Polyangiaceae bacterium]|nr:hypothetical protein [Polyangiaceae bacterium]